MKNKLNYTIDWAKTTALVYVCFKGVAYIYLEIGARLITHKVFDWLPFVFMGDR